MLEARHASEIAERYALGSGAELEGPVARGEIGQVWRLTAEDGTWAVKESFEPYDVAEVREESDFQDVLHAAGVPLPAVIRTTDGEVLADIGGGQVRLFDWVDLRERDASLDPAGIGGLLASIHRVRSMGKNPVHPWFTDPVGAKRWDELVSALLAADAPFAEPLAAYRDELVAMEQLLEAPANLQTCHRDLWADNVRATASGGLCVIDWEDSGLSDPSQELSLVLFEFGGTDSARARTLYEAYVDEGGPGRVTGPSTFSTPIAQLGHICERHCVMWLDPGSSDAVREHAESEMRDNFARPLTRAVIDQLLDAVSI